MKDNQYFTNENKIRFFYIFSEKETNNVVFLQKINIVKITFLGTGTSQGVPVIGSDHPVGKSNDLKDKRLRTSIMVSLNNINIAIDCSPDFRQQMLMHNVTHLEAILFTHEHADHTAGLDDIRPFVLKQGDMPIYAQKRVIEALTRRFDYIFATENRYPGAPSVKVFQVEDMPFQIAGNQVVPISVQHGSLPILGYRIGDMAYITDASFVSEEEFFKLKHLKVLIVNSLRKEEHPTHFNLEQSLRFAEKIGAEHTYFTHISHSMGFHHQVQSELPANVFLAYDNLVIEVK